MAHLLQDELPTQWIRPQFDLSSTGEWCLDFVNTVNWRTGEHPVEQLNDYVDLVRWALQLTIMTAGQARALLDRANKYPAEAEAALRRALALREAIYRVLASFFRRDAAAPEDMAVLNASLAGALAHLQVGIGSGHFNWTWANEENDLDRVTWPVAYSAARLLTSDHLEHVGQCADPGCGWLFLDTSRNHTRRWCDMKDCGNRAKARRHYQRRRGPGGARPEGEDRDSAEDHPA